MLETDIHQERLAERGPVDLQDHDYIIGSIFEAEWRQWGDLELANRHCLAPLRQVARFEHQPSQSKCQANAQIFQRGLRCTEHVVSRAQACFQRIADIGHV